jgi:tetratricopeptide (TPR) repeat protein
MLSSLLILVITTLVIVMIKRLPYLFTGWMWYAITIAPVIGIIQISAAAPYAMADRYHYLPSIGLAVMMAWGIPALIKSDEIRKKIIFPAGIIFLAVLSFLSWHQCGYWKNDFELFKHTLHVTKDNYIAHMNLGIDLSDKRLFDEAIDQYNQAIRIKPDYVDAYNNRGFNYLIQGNKTLGCPDAQKACALGNCKLLELAKRKGDCR